jgi:hypothetical protein
MLTSPQEQGAKKAAPVFRKTTTVVIKDEMPSSVRIQKGAFLLIYCTFNMTIPLYVGIYIHNYLK